jgi:DEP domain-containing protein 5
LPIKIQSEWFERELVKSFNFVLDTESDSSFSPNSRTFSYQRKAWPCTQYVHRTGIAFVQILPNYEGFLWINNRLHLANLSTISKYSNLANPPQPELIRDQFESFCGDSQKLQFFYESLEKRLKVSVAASNGNLNEEKRFLIFDS